MKIVFMGTPEFAVSALAALIDAGHEIIAVYTREDKPKNRGMKMMMPPVKELALQHNIPVFQPKSVKTEEEIAAFRALNADVAVVAAYGRLLPQEILDAPTYGCINIHASLLPKYRGASPITAAIQDGETETGITIMQMDIGLDTGDMLLKGSTPISDSDTFAAVHDRLADLGGKLIVEALDKLEAGTLVAEKQGEAASRYASMIKAGDTEISFNNPARTVSCHIRAFDPAPAAYGFLGGNRLKLYGTVVEPMETGKPAGTILKLDKQGILVACADGGVVRIPEVQGDGGKRMPANAYFNGHRDLLDALFI